MKAFLLAWLSISMLVFSVKLYKISKVEFHPLYITVTEIKYNAKDKTLNISCKIFTNDFETALEKVYKRRTDLSNPKQKDAADKTVNDYIQRHFQIRVNGKHVALEFVESEEQIDATWSYFQVQNVTSVKKIEIMNSLLYETFEGQVGIIHVTVFGKRKNKIISNPETNTVFEF